MLQQQAGFAAADIAAAVVAAAETVAVVAAAAAAGPAPVTGFADVAVERPSGVPAAADTAVAAADIAAKPVDVAARIGEGGVATIRAPGMPGHKGTSYR